jgi:hypothetical protein
MENTQSPFWSSRSQTKMPNKLLAPSRNKDALSLGMRLYEHGYCRKFPAAVDDTVFHRLLIRGKLDYTVWPHGSITGQSCRSNRETLVAQWTDGCGHDGKYDGVLQLSIWQLRCGGRHVHQYKDILLTFWGSWRGQRQHHHMGFLGISDWSVLPTRCGRIDPHVCGKYCWGRNFSPGEIEG